MGSFDAWRDSTVQGNPRASVHKQNLPQVQQHASVRSDQLYMTGQAGTNALVEPEDEQARCQLVAVVSNAACLVYVRPCDKQRRDCRAK